MIPTPDLSHIQKQDFDRVYEPAGNAECKKCSRSNGCYRRGYISVVRRIRGRRKVNPITSTSNLFRDRVNSAKIIPKKINVVDLVLDQVLVVSLVY